jgi:hypothetical protein
MLRAEPKKGAFILALANALSALYAKEGEEERLAVAVLLGAPTQEGGEC